MLPDNSIQNIWIGVVRISRVHLLNQIKKVSVKFINISAVVLKYLYISNASGLAERATVYKRMLQYPIFPSVEQQFRIGISKHRQMIDKCLYFPMCRRDSFSVLTGTQN